MPKELKDLFEQIPVELSDTPERALWHYTTAAGLHGILTSKVVYATHVEHLNDPTELQTGQELISQVASAMLHEDEVGLRSRVLSGFLQAWSDESQPTATFGTYVTSFCDDGGDRLSQWRGYAGFGAGYSIGFKRLDERIFIGDNLVKVHYDHPTKSEDIRVILRRGVAIANAAAASKKWEDDAIIASAVDYLTFGAWLSSLRIKHPGYREEQEWRISSTGGAGAKFRPTERGIVPYLEISLADKDGLLPIEGIYLGPANNTQAGRRAIVGLLLSLGYRNAENLVRLSKVPFRGV